MPQTLTTTEALAAFCARAALEPYVTVDTEFLRERTYYAKLCLVQLAYPGEGDENAVLVDPLAEGMSLEAARIDPAGIRSMVLDSLVSLQSD